MGFHKQNIAGLSKGFTLIEMIAAIVVSAILAIGIVDYIGRAVDGFGSTANRNQLASAGRTAIDRLSMEIHNALPNSIRTTTANGAGEQCMEFIPVRAATNYINPPLPGWAEQLSMWWISFPLNTVPVMAMRYFSQCSQSALRR